VNGPGRDDHRASAEVELGSLCRKRHPGARTRETSTSDVRVSRTLQPVSRLHDFAIVPAFLSGLTGP